MANFTKVDKSNGQVLVAPHANATNKRRFCVLWDTSRKRLEWVYMNTSSTKRLCF